MNIVFYDYIRIFTYQVPCTTQRHICTYDKHNNTVRRQYIFLFVGNDDLEEIDNNRVCYLGFCHKTLYYNIIIFDRSNSCCIGDRRTVTSNRYIILNTTHLRHMRRNKNIEIYFDVIVLFFLYYYIIRHVVQL